MNATVQNGKAQLPPAQLPVGGNAADIFPALSATKGNLDADFKSLIASCFNASPSHVSASSGKGDVPSGVVDKKPSNRTVKDGPGAQQPNTESNPLLGVIPIVPPVVSLATRPTMPISDHAPAPETASNSKIAQSVITITSTPLETKPDTGPDAKSDAAGGPGALFTSPAPAFQGNGVPSPGNEVQPPELTNPISLAPAPLPQAAVTPQVESTHQARPQRVETDPQAQAPPASASGRTTVEADVPKTQLESAQRITRISGEKDRAPLSAPRTVPEAASQTAAAPSPAARPEDIERTQASATSALPLKEEESASTEQPLSQPSDPPADPKTPSGSKQENAVLGAWMVSALAPASQPAESTPTAPQMAPQDPGPQAPVSSAAVQRPTPRIAAQTAKATINSAMTQAMPITGRPANAGSKKETKATEPAARTNRSSVDNGSTPSDQPAGADAVHPTSKQDSPWPDKSSAIGGTGRADAVASSFVKGDAPGTSHEVGQMPQGNRIDPEGDEISSSQLPSIVNTAKLVQGIGQSELRIGLQSRELGSVDIRTSIAAHTFTAQIFVEHRDVANTLSSELPGLYLRLADQRVLTGPIQIHSDGLSTSAGFDQGKRQEYVPASQPDFRTGTFERDSRMNTVFEAAASSDRLDIRI